MNFMKWKTIIFVFTLMGLLFVTGGQAQNNDFDSEDVQIGRMAREKTYPGGMDEENIEVQPQLIKPTRKMGGSSIPVEDHRTDDEF